MGSSPDPHLQYTFLHNMRINFESCYFTRYEIHSDVNAKKAIGFFLLSFKCNITYVSLYVCIPGDQKVSVHLMVTIHMSGAQTIFWSRFINEEVLLRVKERRNILHEVSKRKANWIGHILRRNCLLQQVIEGKIKEGIEVTGRRGRRRKKVLDDLKERRGYFHLKEEDLDRTMWRASFGRGFGPVVKQTTKWMIENK